LKIYDLNTAREKIQAYCAYQERCHMEVTMKLKSWGLIQEAIDLLIIELIQFNFLNEERYARSFTSGKFRIKKWGKLKIRMALKKREVYFKCIDLAMLEIDDKTYLNTLKELLQKKNDVLKETNSYKRKMKLIRYLVTRGYEYDLIHDALVELKLC
jgi:regulatory protein